MSWNINIQIARLYQAYLTLTNQVSGLSGAQTLNFYKPLFPTLVKQSIIYPTTTTITQSKIYATLDGFARESQYFTFGKSVAPHYVLTGSGGNTLAISQDGNTFQGLGTSLFSVEGLSAFYTGSRWLVGGDGSSHTLGYSDDGFNFTGLGKGIFSSKCRCFAQNNTGRIVAGGAGGNGLAYSDNGGLTWNGLGTSVLGECRGIAYNGEYFIAVGQSGLGQINKSYDGINWVNVASAPFDVYAVCVCWNGRLWLAGGNCPSGTTATVFYSYDGTTWLNNFGSINAVIDLECNSITYTGQYFVAGGSHLAGGGGAIGGSTDGVNWFPISGGIFDNNIRAVNWSGSAILFGGGSAVKNTLAYSPDAQHVVGLGSTIFTTECTGIAFNFDRPNRITFPTNRVVVGGLHTGAHSMLYSDDKITYTPITSVGATIFTTTCNGLAYANGVWVGCGQDGYNLARSLNGRDWVGTDLGVVFSFAGRGIAYGNGVWIATGQGTVNTLARSTDNGLTWSGVGRTLFTNTGFGVAFGDGKFVSVGFGSNTIGYSTNNGLTWTPVVGSTSIFTTRGNSVLYANGIWMAGGAGGNCIATSPDGINWTPRPSASAFLNIVNEISYNAGRWVASGSQTGSTYDIIYSDDNGVSWTGLNVASIGTGQGGSWVGDRFLIGGGGGASTASLIQSPDGKNWNAVAGSLALLTNINAVAWNRSGSEPIITMTDFTLDPNNKLDVVPANYGNNGYNNFTISIK